MPARQRAIAGATLAPPDLPMPVCRPLTMSTSVTLEMLQLEMGAKAETRARGRLS